MYAIIFFLAAWGINHSIRKAINSALRRDPEERIDRTAIHFIRKLAHIAVYFIAFLFYAHLIPALRHFGTALLASFGLASVVIALAAQNTLGNVIAGISILLYRPFKVGNMIQLQTPTGVDSGDIESLGLGYTIIQTFDNRRIVVPNSLLVAQTTVNLSDPQMMTIESIGLDYEVDIDRAGSILTDISQAHPLVREIVGCPVAYLSSNGVALSLRAWCDGISNAVKVRTDLYEQAKAQFDKESIGIANSATNVDVRMQSPSQCKDEKP